jgi:putative ABC transport system permease protein
MGDLIQDVRLALRSARRDWHLGAGICITIGVAVAALTATLTIVNVMFLRSLPVPNAERLYRIRPVTDGGRPAWVSLPTFSDWQRESRLSLFGYTAADFAVFGDGNPEPLLGAVVTERLFELLGVRAAQGRTFTSDEHTVGGERVVVLTHEFWRRRFGGDTAIIGKLITLSAPPPLGEGAFRVVGVMPQSFWLFYHRLDVLVPLRPTAIGPADRTQGRIENLFMRLDDGVSAEAAERELSTLLRNLRERYGAAEPIAAAPVVHIQADYYRDFESYVLIVLLSAVLMFALAGTNVVSLLISGAINRRHEFVVRLALGASRVRVLRHVVIEGVLLGVTGGALGLGLAPLGAGIVRAILPAAMVNHLPGGDAALTIDGSVLAIAGGAILLVAMAGGLCAAAVVGRGRLAPAARDIMRTSTHGPGRARLRAALVAVQLTLAIALTSTTLLAGVTLLQLRHTNLGVQPDGLYAFWVNVSPQRYRTAAQRAAFYDRAIEHVRAVPGVASVSGVDFPFSMTRQTTTFRTAVSSGMNGQIQTALLRSITPDYFATSGIRLVSGRGPSSEDRAGGPATAVVSETLGSRLWPGEDPIGQQLFEAGENGIETPLIVVGVVRDVRPSPQDPPAATLYRPVAQATPDWLYLMVRTHDATGLRDGVVRSVWLEDPNQPVEGPYSMADWVSEMTDDLMFVVYVGLGFAVVAVILAFASIYGLTLDWVLSAQREIGIRRALGATAGDVDRLLLKRFGRIAVVASATGTFLAVGLLRVLRSEVHTLSASGLWVLPLSALLFAFLAGWATYLSSRTAAVIDPAHILRADR